MRSFGAAVTVLRGAVCALARVPRLTAHAYMNPVLAIVAVKGSVSSACWCSSGTEYIRTNFWP